MPVSRLVITLAISCLAGASLAQSAAQPLTARIIRIHGDARLGTTTNDWRPARAGDLLHEGALIQTGIKKDSFLDLVIGEGQGQPLIRLWANTALRLDQLLLRGSGNEPTIEAHLDLPAGRITGKIGNPAPDSRFEVKLPVELLGIRPPSVFEILSDGSASVASGTIVIVRTANNAVGDAIVVNPGKRYDAKSETVVTLPESDRRDLEKSLMVPGSAAPRSLLQPGPSEPRPQRKF